MVLSPYDGLPGPVVASAWGTQLVLTGVDDPRLEEFIKAYRQGPQTPEPGAACTGGCAATSAGERMTGAGSTPRRPTSSRAMTSWATTSTHVGRRRDDDRAGTTWTTTR